MSNETERVYANKIMEDGATITGLRSQLAAERETSRTLKDCLADGLRLMNGALRMCGEKGPRAALIHLERCMGDRDMIEEDMPDDCVTKWTKTETEAGNEPE